MWLTVQQVFDAVPLLALIIRERRPMSQIGKYKVMRLHAKLLPEFNVIAAQRDELIKAYDWHPPKTELEPQIVEDIFAVPPDKVEDFLSKWGKLAAAEIEVDVEAVPIGNFDIGGNGSIEANELAILGDLISG